MSISKTQEAYSIIKAKIISGELAPKSDISEEALQAELNVSRTPIREALQLLQKDGFVDIYPRKGIIVTGISLDLLNQIYDIRLVLEPFAAKRALGRISDSFLIKSKEKFLKIWPDDASVAEVEKYYTELDYAFHAAIHKYADNRFISDVTTLVSEHEKRVRHITFDIQTNKCCISEHIDIIDAFLDRDLDRLLTAVTTHVEHARKNVFSQILHI